jgi:N-acetylglucosamine kinase-like BadF-type ATPase
MTAMQIVAGVDGGSTKTVALISDLEGHVIGAGRAGPSNHELIGHAKAAESVRLAVEAALAHAHRQARDLVFAHMGLSGQDWAEDEVQMRAALAPWLGATRLALENDAFLGVRACTPDARGITVSAGSGVCCSLIRENGTKYCYGYHADLGGGIDIDARTMHAVVRSQDGRGPPTELTAALLTSLGFATVPDMLHAISRRGYEASHRLVRPALFGAAEGGDPIARRIVEDFGRELALFATNLVYKEGLGALPVDVVATGSLFVKTGALLFSTFKTCVRAAAARASIHLADQEPAVGAVRAALAACGVGGRAPWHELKRTTTPWLETLQAQK